MDVAIELTNGFRLQFISYAVISVVVALWCRYKWKRRNIDRLAAKLSGPPSYPIIGTGLEFLGLQQQTMDILNRMVLQHGPEPFNIWLGTYLCVFVMKPEDVQIVLNSSKALEKGFMYRFFKKITGDGLFTAPIDKWRVHRRLISPVFNANLLNQFIPVFKQKNEIMIKNLNKEVGKIQPFDLWDYIAPNAVDTICQTMMGYNINSQLNNDMDFMDTLTKISELGGTRVYKPWLYPDFVFSIYLKLKSLQNIYKKTKNFPNQKKKEAYAQWKIANKINDLDHSINGGERKQLKVFLDILLELKEAGVNISDEDIEDEVVTMLYAGIETNAVTICFCLLLLAIHPDIQDKVYEEITEVLGDSNELITIEDTNKLQYLEQILKETLRMYPPGPILARELQDDIKISSNNYVLPKGTMCIITPMGTHHIEELYPNPWSFNPDHFKPENVMKRHKYSFIPFSGGPRGCIGSKYAMLSMKILLSTFLRNFSVHTDIKLSDIKLKVDLLLRSVHGYPVTIRLRDKMPTCKLNQKV